MNIKKILIRGAIIGLILMLGACAGIGVIDWIGFGIIAVPILILAALMVIIHNQRKD